MLWDIQRKERGGGGGNDTVTRSQRTKLANKIEKKVSMQEKYIQGSERFDLGFLC